MTIDERRRHALYERLDALLQDEHADTLMSMLPPVGWADVATKQDVHATESGLRLSLESLESRMQGGFSEVRAEMTGLREELHVGLAELRTELHKELRQQLWAILGVLVMALVISEAVSRLG